MSNALLSSIGVTVRNLGGIDAAGLSLHQGVNVFFGENASNRSSLFSAIAGALGARVPTPKTDTQSSLVRLEHGDAEYVVDIDRSDGTRQVTAHTLTTRTALCDHFVRLLEDNPLRQSVERMDEVELYELLMEPVDTAEIESQIDRAKTERGRVDKQLSHYDDLQSRLPSLRTTREQLREERDEVAEEIDSVQAELEDRSQSTTQTDDQQFSELESKRDRYRDLTATLRTQQEALDSLKDERQAVEEELADQTDGHDVESVDDAKARIDDRRGRKRQLANTIQLLQTVIEAGRKTTQQSADLFDTATDGSRASNTARDHESETDHGHVTDTLTQSTEAMACLTCGSTVTPEDIEGQITELQSIIADKRDEQQALDEEIASLEATRDRIQTERDRIDRLHRRAEQLDTEIDETEATIESLQADRADLDIEIDALEAAVAQHEHDADSAQQELQDRLTDLEVDRGRIEVRRPSRHADALGKKEVVDPSGEKPAPEDRIRDERDAAPDRDVDSGRPKVPLGPRHPLQRPRGLGLGKAREKLRRPFPFRALEELFGWALFDEASLLEEEHLGGRRAGKSHLVGHHQHRHPLRGQFPHHPDDFAGELRIQRARGLVEQHELRVHRERSGDPHSLLLPAGEFGRVRVGLIGEADLFEFGHRAGLRALSVHPRDLPQSQRHVSEGREMGKEIDVLEDHPDLPAEIVDVVARITRESPVEIDGTGVRLGQAVHTAQKRRFAAATRADQDERLAFRHLEGDVSEYRLLAVALLEVFDAKEWIGHVGSPDGIAK